MIKGSIYVEDVTNINIDVPNSRAPKYMKIILIELKRKIDNSV
jgi:hypothetical protein